MSTFVFGLIRLDSRLIYSGLGCSLKIGQNGSNTAMKLHSLRFLPVIAIVCCAAAAAFGADSLETGFQHPPDSAKPQTWWHWMNGNVTKEGITLDLEAMKRVGLAGAQIFNADSGIPAGPVKFMSPEWREMFKHAVEEADRL